MNIDQGKQRTKWRLTIHSPQQIFEIFLVQSIWSDIPHSTTCGNLAILKQIIKKSFGCRNKLYLD